MSTFKNYTIIKSLGKGGMAEVFLAEDNRFHSKVAIKILHPELSLNSNISHRFLSEARSLFKMSHPNIVRVTDLIEEEGKKAFVMEYIEGKNLRDESDRVKSISPEDIRTWMPQMISALGYCHSKGFVHRDIKPSNFMLTTEGQIKLLDFGIAKKTDNHSEYTQTGTAQLMGTPLYMSPEQILETKSVDFRSDIYSLGVVLWQLVTGKKPYDSQTLSAFQIQLKIVNEPLAVTGSKLDEIIQKCTAKDPSMRFQNCEEMKLAFEILADDSSASISDEKTIIEVTAIKDIATNVSTPNPKPKPSPSSRPLNNTVLKSKNSNRKLLFGISIFFLIVFSVVIYVVTSEYNDHSDWYPPEVKSEISRRGKWSESDKEAFIVDLQNDVKNRKVDAGKWDFEACCLSIVENDFSSYEEFKSIGDFRLYYERVQWDCGADFSEEGNYEQLPDYPS